MRRFGIFPTKSSIPFASCVDQPDTVRTCNWSLCTMVPGIKVEVATTADRKAAIRTLAQMGVVPLPSDRIRPRHMSLLDWSLLDGSVDSGNSTTPAGTAYLLKSSTSISASGCCSDLRIASTISERLSCRATRSKQTAGALEEIPTLARLRESSNEPTCRRTPGLGENITGTPNCSSRTLGRTLRRSAISTRSPFTAMQSGLADP